MWGGIVMEQVHPACSEAGRPSFFHVVNHLGQNRTSVVFTIDVLARLKHLYSNCAFTIKTYCKHSFLWRESWLQNRVSPGFGWHPMPVLLLIRHHKKIKPLHISSYNVWESTPAHSVKYINHFLSRCHSLSLPPVHHSAVVISTRYKPFSYEDDHEVLCGHLHRIWKGDFRLFGCLIWGSSSMSQWTWSILALVMDVTLWPVCSLCLSDSSPHSNWATHLWTMCCKGTYWIPQLTKFWCICITANLSFHFCNVRNLTFWLCENDAIFTTVLRPARPKRYNDGGERLGIDC